MRTNINAIVTNCTVFGFGQDRAVATRNDESCARAAQHLVLWHAGTSDRRDSRALKRRDWAVVAVALVAKRLCLAITGLGRPPVRHMSPALVMA
jgi:hypothetical protein